MKKLKVAILGTGLMGSSAAKKLAEGGFSIILWNRTIEKAKELSNKIKNSETQNSPWNAVENADVAITFVSDDNAFLNIISQMKRADGLLFINSSTITPNLSIIASQQLKDLGMCYVEAPIIGGPKNLEEGNATFMVAGEKHCIRFSRGLLSTMGSVIELGDEQYKAIVSKLAYNSILISSISILSESIALLESYGIEKEKIKEITKNTAFSSIIDKYFDRIVNKNSPMHFKLSLAAKDLEYASRAAYDAGLAMPTINAASQIFKQAELHGLGNKDYTRIYDFIKPK
ncbi:MAG: NAD(P)-dependent oxidoreductase [Caldisphaera sp.]